MQDVYIIEDDHLRLGGKIEMIGNGIDIHGRSRMTGRYALRLTELASILRGAYYAAAARSPGTDNDEYMRGIADGLSAVAVLIGILNIEDETHV